MWESMGSVKRSGEGVDLTFSSGGSTPNPPVNADPEVLSGIRWVRAGCEDDVVPECVRVWISVDGRPWGTCKRLRTSAPS